MLGTVSAMAQTTNTNTKQDSIIQKPVLRKKIVPMNRINVNKQNTPVDKTKSNRNNVNGKQEDTNGQPQ